MTDDKRLIEDYLPIVAISAEASREKSVRKGHISTLHLWWARRPLVACRAAVYGALVPASRFVPNGGSDEKKKSLGRANSAKFVKALCQHPARAVAIEEAQRHILIAHADRLTQEIADWKSGNAPKPGWVEEFNFSRDKVTMEDIIAGRAPRPRVLDMFAGGGAIPLEALRLGCDAYALDLNPVAHILQLCTLVYPQQYGKADPDKRGMTGPNNGKGETTWGGLAVEVRYWGNWVLNTVRAEIGDLYPIISDPQSKAKKKSATQLGWFKEGDPDEIPEGYLMPVAYLWTRTVTCKNPACGATVPLVRQTWLCKKKGRYVAMKMVAPKSKKQVHFEVVEAKSERSLGFDPTAFSKAGNAACPFCGTVADSTYVKAEGCAGRMGQQMMAVVCTRPGKSGRVYLAVEKSCAYIPDEDTIRLKIKKLCKDTGLTVPNEPIINDAKSALFPVLYGFASWGDVFTARQMLALLSFTSALRRAHDQMISLRYNANSALSLLSYLALYVDRAADHWSSLCAWNPTGEKLQHTYGRQALPMVWDFSEANPFGGSVGDWAAIVLNGENGIEAGVCSGPRPADVRRGSATNLPYPDGHLDAVITDPPYYDNVPYADISDFFYVWLKRTVGSFYSEHFANEGTPKKKEIVADAVRHGRTGKRQKRHMKR